MRTIKFKAKRVDNGEWVFGDLFRTHDDHHSPSTSIFTTEYSGNSYGSRQRHEIDPETVCQFTGFVDSEGTEVYEGDATENGRVIVWRRGAFWSDQILGEGKFPITFNQEERIDDWIIGNIHDK